MDSTLKELIVNTLSPLNIPVTFSKYDGSDRTYITFFEYLQQLGSATDDEEDTTEHYIQFNLYYLDDIEDLCKQIVDLLKIIDFKRTEIKDCNWDSETQRYWITLTFFYLEKIN